MTLRLYNTLTKKKEEFKPIDAGKAGIYVCGITVYDICHVGHARSAIVFDVITRYLQYRGFDVTYVKNYTDVDDKIIAKANAEGATIGEIAERYIRAHDRDMDDLGVARPSVAPKATDHIGGMIQLVRTLLEKDLAYVSDGDVYYRVDKFQDYGKLSGRSLEDMMAGARVEVGDKKRNPMDFALWKASKEGEPWWDSPWGKGRPGWHLECSVMSRRYLGDVFDIHGGGEDLIFPHHENEIAQSEGATGKLPANYWLHNGFIKVNSEKMSKSLGNIFSVQDILKLYHPEVLRLFILQSHYKSPVDFSEGSLMEARAGMNRFYETLKKIDEVIGTDGLDVLTADAGRLAGKDKNLHEVFTNLRGRFIDAMDDDFNTARALGCLFEAARDINGYLGEKKFKATKEAIFVLAAGKAAMLETGAVLGLFRDEPTPYLFKDRDREATKRGLDIAQIERLIAERKENRDCKDWSRADEIRKILAEKGIVLKDVAGMTSWTIE
jgi:cysteinyl-tRNA synthetase